LHGEMLDNVTFGAVPEPSVVCLIGVGAVCFGCRLFRKPRS
jgi:hypothetical protein